MRKRGQGQSGPTTSGSGGISCGTILSIITVAISLWISFVIYHVIIAYQQQQKPTDLTPLAAPVIPSSPAIPPPSSSSSSSSSSSTASSFTSPPPASSSHQPLPSLKSPPSTEPPIHVVFSTDCGTFQDWQTLVFFYSARIVKQPGMVTRIASGCTEEKKATLLALYQKLFPEYSVHFTPDYSRDERTGQKYHFYNKPYGVLHWIEHSSPPIAPGTIVAICDPDFIFLRPLTAKIHQPNTIVTLWSMEDVKQVEYVKKGHPVAQQYGLGAPWVNDNHAKFNRTFICGENSPCRRVPSQNAGGKAYAVGPPYILEVSDLHRLTRTWCEFVPRVYVKYPYLLAEMYGYSMAAAHEELPHLTVDHHMVSEIDAYGEGWKWVDDLGDHVCELPNANGIYYPDRPLPTFVHYCQAYRIDDVGYGKRRIPHDIFSCTSPMLLEPKPDMVHSRSFIKDNKVFYLFPISSLSLTPPSFSAVRKFHHLVLDRSSAMPLLSVLRPESLTML